MTDDPGNESGGRPSPVAALISLSDEEFRRYCLEEFDRQTKRRHDSANFIAGRIGEESLARENLTREIRDEFGKISLMMQNQSNLTDQLNSSVKTIMQTLQGNDLGQPSLILKVSNIESRTADLERRLDKRETEAQALQRDENERDKREQRRTARGQLFLGVIGVIIALLQIAALVK